MSSEERAEILEVLRSATEATVSTYGGEVIRSRAMHYAVADDFTIYLASMKGDPKILHISNIPSVTLLILHKATPPETYMDLREFGKWSEIEIHGRASIVRDEREREYAIRMLAERSPIVKLLYQNNQTGVLEVIRVEPQIIKYKRVRDILEGKPPIVISFEESRDRGGDITILARKLKNLYYAMRVPFIAATIPSIVLGGLLALYHRGVFDPVLFILTLIGTVAAHLGLNLMNDYYDYKMGVDQVNKEGVFPFTGGSRVLQMGLLSPLEVFFTSIFMISLSVAIAVYLALVVTPLVLAVATLGFAIIFAYHVPPLRLVDRGLGELLVGLGFGPVYTLGTYLVMTGELSMIPVLASLPLALLVADILVVNEFPDYKGDLEAGKHNLVVRLGRRRARWLSHVLHFTAYLLIPVLYLMGIYPPESLIALLGLPLSIYGKINLHRNYESPFDMIPAIVSNIVVYVVTGFLISVGILFSVSPSPALLASILMGIAGFTIYELVELRRGVRAFNLLRRTVSN